MANLDEYGYVTLDENDRANESASNSSTGINSTYQPTRRTGVLASSGMFWFLTLAISLGIQALVHYFYGEEIVGEIFGYGYGSGIES